MPDHKEHRKRTSSSAQLQAYDSAYSPSLEEHISCALCKDILIDAVTLTECTHSCCRSCLLKYLIKNNRCPRCNNDLGSDLGSSFHVDRSLQDLTYKLAPDHYWQELRQRIEFINRTRLSDEDRKTIANKGLARLASKLCSEDEKVSVALEYVAVGDLIMMNMKKYEDEVVDDGEPKPSTSKNVEKEEDLKPKLNLPTTFTRFFRCPAKTSIHSIKKILELKIDLSENYNIFFMCPLKQEALLDEFTMQDLAYLYTWNRKHPLKLIFTLQKIEREEDRPPLLDVQEMPELTMETPMDSLSTTAPELECEPMIPSLTVSLNPSVFENMSTNGENGPVHHPPIITTTVPPPPKKRKKISAEKGSKKTSNGPAELNSSKDQPPSAENSLIEPPVLNSSSAENTPTQPLPQTSQTPPQIQAQPLIPAAAQKGPHLLPILPKPEGNPPPLTPSSLGLVPTNGLPNLPMPAPSDQVINMFNMYQQFHQAQVQHANALNAQAQASALSAAMPHLYQAFRKQEENDQRLPPHLQAAQGTLLPDGKTLFNAATFPGGVKPMPISGFSFLQSNVEKARLPIISRPTT